MVGRKEKLRTGLVCAESQKIGKSAECEYSEAEGLVNVYEC